MSEVLVGVISDTHGLVRPEAVSALKGSELLIHAGDIGNPQVIVKKKKEGKRRKRGLTPFPLFSAC